MVKWAQVANTIKLRKVIWHYVMCTCPSRYPNRAADCSSPMSGKVMLNSACTYRALQ